MTIHTNDSEQWTPTPDFVKFVEEQEGFRADAYLDVAGVPTIGFGRTENVKMGDTTNIDAETQYIATRLTNTMRMIAGEVKVPVTQSQLEAMTSLAYNIGDTAFKDSTLLRLLNSGDYQGALHQFKVWNIAGGKVNDGLVSRRAREAAWFVKDDTVPEVPAAVADAKPVLAHGHLQAVIGTAVTGSLTAAATVAQPYYTALQAHQDQHWVVVVLPILAVIIATGTAISLIKKNGQTS